MLIVDLQVSAILVAILNFSNSSMVTEWHPVNNQSGPFKDSKSTEKLCVTKFQVLQIIGVWKPE